MATAGLNTKDPAGNIFGHDSTVFFVQNWTLKSSVKLDFGGYFYFGSPIFIWHEAVQNRGFGTNGL